MTRTLTHEEQRDEAIAELTEKHLGKRGAALLAGDERTITDVCNSVSDKLGSDDSVVRDLVMKTMGAGGRVAISKAFGDLVVAVMRADAEVDAIREVEALEKAAQAERGKPKTRAMAGWLQAQEERF